MERPVRIASLLASATEILYGIGVGDQVLAVSHECDYPPAAAVKPRATVARINSEQSSHDIDAQVKQKLAAGQPLYEVDWPLLDRLRPDVIVTQAQCDVCSVRYRDVVERVEAEPCFQDTQVIALNPDSIHQVLDDVARIGERIGRTEQATRYVDHLQARIDAIGSAVATIDPTRRPRVAMVEWTRPLMLAGNWMPQLITMAGGISQVASDGSHSAYASWDEVSSFDPEVVVIAPCGFDLQRSRREASDLSWDVLRNTSAGRAGRIHVVDGNSYFNRSGPRLVDSLEILAHLFHPHLVEIPLPVEQWDLTVGRIDG